MQRTVHTPDGRELAVDDLTIDLPNGRRLLTDVKFEADPATPLLITGRNGIGKSTVLRAVSGLWPFGRGRVRLPEGRVFFVPQKPYLPLGILGSCLLMIFGPAGEMAIAFTPAEIDFLFPAPLSRQTTVAHRFRGVPFDLVPISMICARWCFDSTN